MLCEFSYRGGGRDRAALRLRGDRQAWHGAVTTLVVADEPGDKATAPDREGRAAPRQRGPTGLATPKLEAAARCDRVVLEIRGGTAHGPRRKVRHAVLEPGVRARGRRYWLHPRRSWTRQRSGGRPRRGGRWSRISSRHRRRRSCGTRSRAQCRTCWPCAASGTSGCEPVLIGPSVLERVLLDALPRAAIAPDRFGKPCRRPCGPGSTGSPNETSWQTGPGGD